VLPRKAWSTNGSCLIITDAAKAVDYRCLLFNLTIRTISPSDIKSCIKDDSALQSLFIIALSMNPADLGLGASLKLAAINALSVQRRGMEELVYIRKSFQLLMKHVEKRLDALNTWGSSFTVLSSSDSGKIISVRKYCVQLKGVLQAARTYSAKCRSIVMRIEGLE
jgi:hypothetical protein